MGHSQQVSGQYQTGQSLKDRVAIQSDIGRPEKGADENFMKMTKSKCQVLLWGDITPSSVQAEVQPAGKQLCKKGPGDTGLLCPVLSSTVQDRHLSTDLERVHQRTTKAVGAWSPQCANRG